MVHKMTLHPTDRGKARLAHPTLEVLNVVVYNPHVGLQTVLAAECQLAAVAVPPLGVTTAVRT